jgi:hypothetical protein
VKFALPRNWGVALEALKKGGGTNERRWPAYLFGGHLRTSTAALVIVFLAVWWIHDTYQPSSTTPTQVPATQVVPPGYVPDPNYTWVPRSRLQQPPSTVTVTETATPTTPPTTTTPATTSPTSSPPPPFGPLPPFVLPPPFGPPPPPPAPPPPPPALGPAPAPPP